MNTLNVVRKLALQAGVVAIAIAASTVEAHAQSVRSINVDQVNIEQPNVSQSTVSTPEVEVPEVTVPEVEVPEVIVPPIQVSVDVPYGSDGAVAVPEPSTAAGLLVIGAVGVGVMWRRKKVLAK